MPFGSICRKSHEVCRTCRDQRSLEIRSTPERTPYPWKELEGKRAVIVLRRLREVASMVKKERIIEFIYKPDAGSVNLLRSSVLEHRNRNSK